MCVPLGLVIIGDPLAKTDLHVTMETALVALPLHRHSLVSHAPLNHTPSHLTLLCCSGSDVAIKMPMYSGNGTLEQSQQLFLEGQLARLSITGSKTPLTTLSGLNIDGVGGEACLSVPMATINVHTKTWDPEDPHQLYLQVNVTEIQLKLTIHQLSLLSMILISWTNTLVEGAELGAWLNKEDSTPPETVLLSAHQLNMEYSDCCTGEQIYSAYVEVLRGEYRPTTDDGIPLLSVPCPVGGAINMESSGSDETSSGCGERALEVCYTVPTGEDGRRSIKCGVGGAAVCAPPCLLALAERCVGVVLQLNRCIDNDITGHNPRTGRVTIW